MRRAEAWALAAVVAASALAAWALLRVDWAPPRATIACADVFASTPRLEVPADPDAPFVVRGDLRTGRPHAVVQHQIVDANGFGWVLRDLPDDARIEHVAQLPRVPATHTVRVALLVPEESARAEATRRAARAFDLRGWWQAQGWLEPAATVCATFEVRP